MLVRLLVLMLCFVGCKNNEEVVGSSNDKIIASSVELKMATLIYELEHFENGYYYISSKMININDDTLFFIANRGTTGFIIRNNKYLENSLGSDSLYFQDDFLLMLSNGGLNELEKNLYRYIDNEKITSDCFFRNKNGELYIIAKFSGEIILMDNYHYKLRHSEFVDSIMSESNKIAIFNKLGSVAFYEGDEALISYDDTIKLVNME